MAHPPIGMTSSGTGTRPSATGATGNGNQSGGASPLQSVPDLVTFGLLSLVSGLIVGF